MGFIDDESPWPGGHVSERVFCLRANNPSPMTHTGTNTYMVAESGSRSCMVIDPAPEGEHIEHILAVCREHGWDVGAIVATHDHPDHINGIPQLAKATGAPVYAPRLARIKGLFAGAGLTYADVLGVDTTQVNAGVTDTGKVLADVCGSDVGSGSTGASMSSAKLVKLQPGEFHPFHGAPKLEIIPLPGHSADSVGLLLVEEQLMFTGDVLFRHGPTVVLHPDGSLSCYFDSLDKLEQLVESGRVQTLCPAHGWPIYDPLQIIKATRRHRMERLKQVRDAIAKGTPAEPDALFDTVYAGVDPRLKPASVRSIQAQLEYLGYPVEPE